MSDSNPKLNHTDNESPWLTAREAAQYARLSVRTIYGEVKAGRLRAAVVGGRCSLRFRTAWLDEFYERCAPQEVERR